MKNTIALEIYNESELLNYKVLILSDWYDADNPEIDSNDYRVKHKITKIKGIHYNYDGMFEEAWANFYDSSGRIIKCEIYDIDFNIIDIEETKYDENGRIIDSTSINLDWLNAFQGSFFGGSYPVLMNPSLNQ